MPASSPPAVESVVYAYETEQAGWRVTGSRVSLDSVIYAYREGMTAEQIVAEYYPSLTPELVHGALALYLRHQQYFDAYLTANEARFEQLREASREQNRDLRERMLARWRKMQAEKNS